MAVWFVPVTIVEYGRFAVVEAETAREARNKARRADWDGCTDANEFKVTVVGAAKKDGQ